MCDSDTGRELLEVVEQSPVNAFTIYYNPDDYPNQFVVREFIISSNNMYANTTATYVGDSLEDARDNIPSGRCLFERGDSDHRSVVETWI